MRSDTSTAYPYHNHHPHRFIVVIPRGSGFAHERRARAGSHRALRWIYPMWRGGIRDGVRQPWARHKRRQKDWIGCSARKLEWDPVKEQLLHDAEANGWVAGILTRRMYDGSQEANS